MDKNFRLFKRVGILEALSFLLLLFIAMPLKYMMDLPDMVKYVGWAHGVLFIAYVAMLVLAADEQKWSFKWVALAFVAALLPFGPFVLHNKLENK
ncbi:MAG: DUF3817 domain-containing protein [Flavobacteriales bacterium]|nr:DUF3817 domain-containing protein [Flavobacteriales bacterium]NNK79979.1 DUF3817 domain-containing protein [Flavobacteriales bacterium]